MYSIIINSGFLPANMLLTQGYTTIGEPNPFKCHEEVLSLQPMKQQNFQHVVVESPCRLVVKRKCIYLHQIIQYCNVSIVFKTINLYCIKKGRWHGTIIIVYYNYEPMLLS